MKKKKAIKQMMPRILSTKRIKELNKVLLSMEDFMPARAEGLREDIDLLCRQADIGRQYLLKLKISNCQSSIVNRK
jgi:hypothetical protein